VTDGKREPLFDPVSYGRGIPGRGRSLSIGRSNSLPAPWDAPPEVMLKVINKGSSSFRSGPGAILGYIGRRGEVELEKPTTERSCNTNTWGTPYWKSGILI